jgi:Selenoprotein, putative
MKRDQTSMAGLKGATRLRVAWSWLRQVSGDAAYENYLRCAGRSVPPLSRAAFYLDSLRRRYSTVSRCC